MMRLVKNGVAVATFLLYASAALMTEHERPTAWQAEIGASLPAAISYSVYGTQLGSMDANVRQAFRDIFQRDGVTPASVENAVEETGRGGIARGYVMLTTDDGLGAGQPLFMSIAMKLFGPYLHSPCYLFLLMMGASALVFVVRFQDDRLFMVPLTFLTLSLMLLTTLVADQNVADQVPIGGNRFFPVLGFLPALHVFFELLDDNFVPSKTAMRLAMAVLQVTFLLFAMFVRSSAAYLLGFLAFAALMRMQATRTDRQHRLQFYRLIGKLAAVGIVFSLLIVGLVPGYAASGRVFGTFWHRAFVSFSLHADWPFGNLRNVYNCEKYIPEGLSRENNDRNGHCVWWVYPPNRARPEHDVLSGTYGSEYESAMRAALFNVISSYPRRAFELYAYYKPSLIVHTLQSALDIDLRRTPRALLLLVAIQVSLFITFVTCGRVDGNNMVTSRSRVIPAMLLLSLPPHFVAWSIPATSVDLIFYTFAMIAATIALTFQLIVSRISTR
jgi:hypothetical protein